MITSYIQELLATNNRVIIPNYGAFLVRATSKGKDSNNLSEKLNDIYFSPFLKFNDELLERFIVKKEGVPKDQAAEKIKTFIEELKTKLSEESAYQIKGFGDFTMDKQGKVMFTPAVLETTTAENKKESVKEEPKKEVKKTTKEAAKKPAAKTKTTKEPEKEMEPETKPVEPIIIEEPKTEIKEEFKPAVKQEIKPPVTQVKPEIKYQPKKKESTINKGLVWAIALGLPLAAIFIWGLLNFETVTKVFKKTATKQHPKTEKTIQPQAVEEKTEVAPAESTEVKPEPVAAEPVKPVSSEKRYYIIAGSFKNENYAISYMKGLQEKGFPAEKLAERNGMHAVSYSSFTDKKQALAEYKVITQEKGMTAWILYY